MNNQLTQGQLLLLNNVIYANDFSKINQAKQTLCTVLIENPPKDLNYNDGKNTMMTLALYLWVRCLKRIQETTPTSI